MNAPEYWEVCALMDKYAPRLARMHNHKMTSEGVSVFCDWLEERGCHREREWIKSHPESLTTPDPFERLDQSKFLNLRRITDWEIGWIQPLLFGGSKVMVGPIADANIGCDSWADYFTIWHAVRALATWDGHSDPPTDGLIRFQLRDREIVKEAQRS